MGRLRRDFEVLDQNKPIRPSDFVNDVYNDKNRGILNGRSHNMLTDLRIFINDKEIKSTKETVSSKIEALHTEIKLQDTEIAEKILNEISRNLVRIDMIHNICNVLKDSEWDNQIGLIFKIVGNRSSDEEDSAESDQDVYESFYSMVKNWVTSDHFNPTIRSEMIWDMLLSDYICDLMRKRHSDENGRILLLAKEFPYSNSEFGFIDDDTDLKGPKVDYLVGIEDVLYFVELKTSLSSFDVEQYRAYKKYATNNPETGFTADALWRRYRLIVEKKPGKGDGHYYDNSGTEKYRYQIDRMKRVCEKTDVDDDGFFEWIKEQYNEIRLTYVTFDRLKSKSIPEEEIDQIVLSEFDDDNLRLFDFTDKDDDIKKLRWGLVIDIIRSVKAGKMPQM